jgi:hypothetical protein
VKLGALFLLVLICIPLTLAIVPPVNALAPNLEAVEVQRVVHLEDFGLVLTNETYTIINNGLEPAFYVSAAFPLEYKKHIQYFRAETTDGAILLAQPIPLIGPNCTGWQIYIPEPILPGEYFTFRTFMALEGFLQLESASGTCVFSEVPTSPYPVRQYSTRFSHHVGMTTPSADFFSGANLTAFAYKPVAVQMDIVAGSGKPIMSYLKLRRQFIIEPWGYLHVYETHKLLLESINDVGWGWVDIVTLLPAGSEFIRAYQGFNNLSASVLVPTNLTQVGTIEITLEYNLQQGDIYEFVVEYRAPLDSYQVVLEHGFSLEINPYFEHPWIIRHQITEFIFPEGSSLYGVSNDAEITISPTGQYVVTFHAFNVTSFDSKDVSLHYVYPIQPAFIRPFLLALFIGALCTVYIAGRRIPFLRDEEEVIPTRPKIDPVILGEFCALFGEKVALLLQTERLERSMLAQKISKPRYRKEKKIFERKLRTLEKELQGRSRPLIDAGGKYKASCRQLELLEAERLSAIEAINALEQRYKQKRITATVYQKLRTDLEKRRDKAVSGMDRILIDLRSELEE